MNNNEVRINLCELVYVLYTIKCVCIYIYIPKTSLLIAILRLTTIIAKIDLNTTCI